MESFDLIEVNTAIRLLLELKNTYGIKYVRVHFLDFDTGETSQMKKSIEEGCNIIQKAKTITYNDDDYVPHLMAFSKKGDRKKLPNMGKVHDFLLCKNKISADVHKKC